MLSSLFSLFHNRKAMSTTTISLIIVLVLATIIFIVFVAGLKGKFDLINP
ncbi:hypothetical protein HN799_05300 [Candidatus Woesearchaeota archaeon]|mgnify:CR=1 FL=1|jgi:hypothetical protein|nr:hypothetical protein [Candidatus Woesearchaeota archaeon]